MRDPRPLCRFVVLAALAGLALPAAGSAQIPGGDPNETFDRRDAARAQYRAEALEQVNGTLEEWADAWLEDETGNLLDAYADRARVRGLAFGFASGKDALEEAFSDFLPRAGDVRLDMREFNASGRLAYGIGTYRFQTAEGGGAGEMVRGQVMTVFSKEDGWKILSQFFVPDGEG